MSEIGKIRLLSCNEEGHNCCAIFYCPGCKKTHPFEIKLHPGGRDSCWTWNGSLDNPTFSPSLLCERGKPNQCHCNVTSGKIVFHSDSWHKLKGQIVDMVLINEHWEPVI